MREVKGTSVSRQTRRKTTGSGPTATTKTTVTETTTQLDGKPTVKITETTEWGGITSVKITETSKPAASTVSAREALDVFIIRLISKYLKRARRAVFCFLDV